MGSAQLGEGFSEAEVARLVALLELLPSGSR
jgi:hypothetical protein